MERKTNSVKWYILSFLALLALAIWSTYLKEPDNNLHIFAFDVGQGDSLLLQKGDYQILVDGGPDNKVIAELGKVMPIEDRKIEKVILTHPHADHLSGLIEVLKRYNVDEIKISGAKHTTGSYLDFLKTVKDKNIPTKVPKIGEVESVFDQGKITYLWPDESIGSQEDNLNNTSIVFRLNYGKFSALFPGDCEVECWQGIIADNKNLIANVTLLKVAHHGSKNGTDQEIASIIRPKMAIISLGKDNKFGFPHKKAMEVLQKTGADIYRTDLQGTIDISTDGENWSGKRDIKYNFKKQVPIASRKINLLSFRFFRQIYSDRHLYPANRLPEYKPLLSPMTRQI